MVLLLTVIAGGGRRSVRLDEEVGVPQPSSAPSPSPLTTPTYLACRPDKRAGKGEWRFWIRRWEDGVEIRGQSRREVRKSSRPFFSLCVRGRAISMVAPARVGIDHLWLSGYRDEVVYGKRLNQASPLGLACRCFDMCAIYNAAST
jgi:hypothetical protein